MKKSFLLSLICSACMSIYAQTDITSPYIINPSFEEDDVTTLTSDGVRGAYVATTVKGWELTGEYGVSDIMTASATATDNNFGAPGEPSHGKQMYYIRYAWKSSSAQLLQHVTLPPGTYRLTVDTKCITQSSHAAALVAGSYSTGLSFHTAMPADWDKATLEFELAENTELNVGISVNFGSGSGASILVDNFRLYQIDAITPEPIESDVESPTEGMITGEFVSEGEMMNDLLQMLSDFTPYLVNDFQECATPNSLSESCGCFRGESTMASNEAGVRTNADLGMICAFLVKYAKPSGVNLPAGVTWDKVEDMAMKSLVFSYSTHKANKLKVCSGNDYWGSTSGSDHVWESSLWAMSVAYSAYFQWEKLSEAQRGYIYALLKAECNYELNRTIPTGYINDTKAEENGWEADVLAAALGLFPNDELAPQWFERLRQFAINSYSHTNDATNQTVIDPWYDEKTVADLYEGQNLYDDYTLQNHKLFHTSYQNVVMQELGEAALALRLFQGETEKWKTNALMHNNQEVMDQVLNWLALTDGELAMPNGNDWSLFLYDQITSYTTQATFQRDPNALMLENLAYKSIKARQKTTTDGAWLLRPDVQARRMGVEAHRVMMTYLMHLTMSTADLTPTEWETFRSERSEAKVLSCQNVVRAFTEDRFTTFSWSTGLASYTGYIAANSVDKNKIIVPYRANNTGNFLGWYTVSGKSTNAVPVVSGIYKLKGNGYTMNGELKTNASTLDNRFVIYSTPGNAVVYIDYVTGLSSGTITGEYGGLTAISVDDLTKTARTLYYGDSHKQSDGSSLKTFDTDWINIDNQVGVVSKGEKLMAFGDRANNNSIMTAKLYPSYSNQSRSFTKDEIVDRRNITYYSNISAEETSKMESQTQVLTEKVPVGWNGLIAPDPDGTHYLLLGHFLGETNEATLSGITTSMGAPVFESETTIKDSKSTASFRAYENNSVSQAIKIFIWGSDIKAKQDVDEPAVAYLTATADTKVTVNIIGESVVNYQVSISAGETIRVSAKGTEDTPYPESVYNPSEFIVNPSFEGNTTFSWEGSTLTASYNEVEKYNSNFDFHQTVSGLKAGEYELSCQGFYRQGSYANAANRRTQGEENINSALYAVSASGEVSKDLPSIFDEANQKGAVGVATAHGYIPNTMEQAAIYFSAGLYLLSMPVRVGEDGILTIGVRKSSLVSSDWTIFDNFRLTYNSTEDAIRLPRSMETNLRSSGVYDLSGRIVGSAFDKQGVVSRGVYIRGGKKVVKL